MNKYLTIGALVSVALCAFAIWQGIQAIERTAHKAGMMQAISAKVESENIALMSDLRVMVEAFEMNQRLMNEIRVSPDTARAPASVQSTIDGLCIERKAAGVPCSTPRPPAKPNVQ